jgi:hypothetical protein
VKGGKHGAKDFFLMETEDWIEKLNRVTQPSKIANKDTQEEKIQASSRNLVFPNPNTPKSFSEVKMPPTKISDEVVQQASDHGSNRYYIRFDQKLGNM